MRICIFLGEPISRDGCSHHSLFGMADYSSVTLRKKKEEIKREKKEREGLRERRGEREPTGNESKRFTTWKFYFSMTAGA